GYIAAAAREAGFGNGRRREHAAGTSRPGATRTIARTAFARAGAEGAGTVAKQDANGFDAAVLLGYELRRNCGDAGRAAPVCGRTVAACAASIAADAGTKRAGVARFRSGE